MIFSDLINQICEKTYIQITAEKVANKAKKLEEIEREIIKH